MNRENTIGETGAPSESGPLGEHNDPEHITLPSDRVLRAALFIDEMIDHLPQIKQRARETFVLGAVTVLGILGQIHPEPAVAESASGRRHIPIESLDTHTVAPAMAGSPPPPQEPQQQETATAVPTVEATPTPTGEVSGKGIPPGQRFTIDLPLVIDQSKKEYHTPVVTTLPPPTEPRKTDTPPVPPTGTATDENPTATSTATATERAPISERIAVPDGAHVAVPGGPNSGTPDYFIKGDPVAIILGQTIDNLEKPFRYGELVIGQRPVVQHDGEGKITGQYTEIAYTNAADLGLSPDKLAEIPAYDANNPEHQLPTHNQILWNGTGGKVLELAGTGLPGYGAGISNGAFSADLSKQTITVSLTADAVSDLSKKADLWIENRRGSGDYSYLDMQYNTRKNQWVIKNSTTIASDFGPAIYAFPAQQKNISFKIINGSTLVIDGLPPIALSSPLTISDQFIMGWGADSSSTLRIFEGKITFDNPDGKPLRYSDQRKLPSLRELAEKENIEIVVPGFNGIDMGIPGLFDMYEKTGQIITTGLIDTELALRDRGDSVPVILHKGDSDTVVDEAIKNNQGGRFLFTEGWFGQDGQLLIAREKILSTMTKIQQAGGKAIIDTQLPINTDGGPDAGSSLPTPTDKIVDLANYLIGNGIAPKTFTTAFSADDSGYDRTNVNLYREMVDKLKQLKGLGLRVGLLHMQSTIKNSNMEKAAGWYTDIGNVALEAHVDMVGFEKPVGDATKLSLFAFEPKGDFPDLLYSEGYMKFRKALEDRILSNQNALHDVATHLNSITSKLGDGIMKIPNAIGDTIRYFTDPQYRIQKDRESRRNALEKTVVFASSRSALRFSPPKKK